MKTANYEFIFAAYYPAKSRLAWRLVSRFCETSYGLVNRLQKMCEIETDSVRFLSLLSSPSWLTSVDINWCKEVDE